MSTTIEFRRWAIHATVANPSYFHDDLYIGFGEYGCNNVIDQDNRVARSIQPLLSGDSNRFMREIVSLSADCEGGCVKVRGRYTKPEGFIANWRRTMNGALSMADYIESAGSLVLEYESVPRAVRERLSEMRLFSDATRERITTERNEYLERLMAHPGVESVDEKDAKDVYTRFRMDRDNHEELTALISEGMRYGLGLRALRRTSFRDHAYNYAELRNKQSAAQA